jgi:UDP-N-acetylmuramoyl-tripeptide--D-alanyl-D-alanine ligase
VYAGRTIALAKWMIDVHQTLQRRRNTGYAYEGIISAYRLAVATGDEAAQQKFRGVCELGLGKLLTWQVGSPVQNAFLRRHAPGVPYAVGGVLNAADDPWLRIDVTQHQMHAIILARRYMWTTDDES